MPRRVIGSPQWQMQLGDYVTTVAVSPDGERVVAGSLAGDAVLLSIDGSLISKLADHAMGVLCGAWSPDGTRVALGGQDGKTCFYDRSGRAVATSACTSWASVMAWAPDSTLLAVGEGRHLRLLDAEGITVRRYPALPSTITAIAWSTNGQRVGANSYGGITWYEPGKVSNEIPARRHKFKGSPLSLALAPNGRWACAGFQDASIHLWRLWSGDDLSMSGYPAKIEHLAFRDDSHRMASACLSELTVWDFSGKGPSGRSPAVGQAHERHITCLAWQPGGTRLLSGGADGRLVLWPSPRSVKRPIDPEHVHQGDGGVAALAWHPAGRSAVVGTADGTIEHLPVN